MAVPDRSPKPLAPGAPVYARSRRLTPTLLVVSFVVFAALYAWMHVRVGFTFPTPWSDEAAYLWTGVALGRSGSAIAPELIPGVQMMWIPPGFTVVNGLVFALLGFSLELARALSAAEVLILFAGLLFTCAVLRAPVASALLCGVFLLSGELVLAGNVGRMEALVLALVGVALALQSRDRGAVLGWAVVALAPVVHPNGLLFVGAATLYLVLQPGSAARLRALSRSERVVLGGVALAWLGYALLVAANWTDFQIQMGAQLSRKLGRETIVGFIGMRDYFFAAVALPSLWWARSRSRPATLLLCYAIFGWAAFSLGLETWYLVYRQLGALLLCLALIELVQGELSQRLPQRLLAAASMGLSAGLLVWLWSFGSLPFPPVALTALSVHQMRPVPGWNRVDESELDEIAARLQPYMDCPERVVVRIHPRAESLVFYGRLGDSSLLFANPPHIFEQVGERDPRYRALPWHIYLIHLAPDPVFMKIENNRAFKRAGIVPGSREHLVLSAGPRSQWYMRVDDEALAAACRRQDAGS